MKRLLFAIMMLAGVTQAMTYTEPFSFSASGYDSVRCSVWTLNRAAGTYTAFTRIKYATAAFPAETTVTIDVDSSYRVKVMWFAPGETYPAISSYSIKPISLSRADSAKIARSVWDADVVALATRTVDDNGMDSVLAALSNTAVGNKVWHWARSNTYTDFMTTWMAAHSFLWDSASAVLDTLQDGADGPIVKATAVISNANMGAIADSTRKRVWGNTVDTAWAAGSFGDSAKTWALTAASSFDPTTDSVLVKMGGFTGGKIDLRQLIIGGENNDTASFFVYNNGTTPAMQIEGDGELGDPALYVHSDSGSAFKMKTDNKYRAGGSPTTHAGFWAEAAGTSGYGGYFVNSNEESTATAIGAGLKIGADGWNNGVTIAVGEAGDTVGFTGTVPNNRAINVEGPSIFYGRDEWRRKGANSDDAFSMHGKQLGHGFYVWSDSGWAARISDSHGDSGSIILGGNIEFGTNQGIIGNLTGHITGGIDTAWIVDTVLKATSVSASLSGNGAYTMTVYATDTSGTDASVAGVYVEVLDLVGSRWALLPTNSSGLAAFNMNSGSWKIQAVTRDGYWWGTDTVVVSGAAKTDTLRGYNIPVASAGTPSLCEVYQFIYTPQGNPAEGVSVSAKLSGTNVVDSCGGNILNVVYAVDTVTDANGRFGMDLNRCKCLQKTFTTSAEALYYEIVGTYNGQTIFSKKVTVPDSSSYKITW